MKPGTLVKLGDRGCFKIGVVVGPSRAPGKVRVCVWSDNSRCWSNPQTAQADSLVALSAVTDMTPRQQRSARLAGESAARAVPS